MIDPRLTLGADVSEADAESALHALDRVRPVVRVDPNLDRLAATAAAGLADRNEGRQRLARLYRWAAQTHERSAERHLARAKHLRRRGCKRHRWSRRAVADILDEYRRRHLK